MADEYEGNLKDTCKICYRSEPEVRIARIRGKGRAKNSCCECRALKVRMKRKLEALLKKHSLDLFYINLGKLENLSSGKYWIKFLSPLSGNRHNYGIISITENAHALITRDGIFEFELPKFQEQLALHLCNRNLILTDEVASNFMNFVEITEDNPDSDDCLIPVNVAI